MKKINLKTEHTQITFEKNAFDIHHSAGKLELIPVEKKEIELVEGEIYYLRTPDFMNEKYHYIIRYKKTINEKLYSHSYFSIHNRLLELSDNFFTRNQKTNLIRPATPEKQQTLIQAEQENGLYWNDEKKCFDELSLENVYYKAETIQDFHDVYGVRIDLLDALNADYCLDNPYVVYDDNTIWNRDNNGNRLQVTKQTFIKLLKNHE